jgi:hypothetical protein
MSSMQLSPNVAYTDRSRSANLLLERGLGRTKAVFATWLVAAVVNIVLFGIGATAGLDYGVKAGDSVWGVMGIGVIVVTTVLLLPGMTLAALLSLRWKRIIPVAQVAGSAISLLTIALTFLAGFDTASAVVLALMHIVAVPILVLGLELIKARDTWTRR